MNTAHTLLRAERAVLWDVDGTLVDSTSLGFTATNEVLETSGFTTITVNEYYLGCRYTTPERFNYHVQQEPGSAVGTRLGRLFDETYVKRVSKQTAGLFPGMERLLRNLAMAGHPQGVLSNACGDYVRAVVAANELDMLPGVRVGLFGIALGADEVSEAKPGAAGLLACCEALRVAAEASVYIGDSPTDGGAARAASMRSIGVSWGANPRDKLDDYFDVVVDDIDSLIVALRDAVGVD